jgi:DNA-binding NarL/FixJ family response regulator
MKQPEPLTLSPRQTEIITLLALGFTNEEAAAKLSITVFTLLDHLKNASARMERRSRMATLGRAIQLGLITLPPEISA